jgi:TonB family protein
MECRVEPDGSLVDCRTIDETPPGFGFGAAVLALAPAFRVQTITPAGVDLVGRPVRVGVSFAVGERYGEAARCQALRLASEGRTLERTAAAAAALRRRAPLMAPSLEEAERRLAQHAGRADLLVREQPGSVARLTESCSEPRPRPDFSRAYVTPVQAWIDPDGVAHAVTRPSWARAPSGYEVARYYPDLATRAAVQGRAQLQCRVSTAGELHGCVVADEAPAGWGFGEATLRMSRTLRFKPELIDGEPVETIGNVPITFLLAR